MEIITYKRVYYTELIAFFDKCLPESGRCLDLNGRHKELQNIFDHFEMFWCMLDNEQIVGTVAIKRINETACELKCLYLLQKYHKQKLGYQLLKCAMDEAKVRKYQKIYLDTLSTSKDAIRLYQNNGFDFIERYNENQKSDVFMMKKI